MDTYSDGENKIEVKTEDAEGEIKELDEEGKKLDKEVQIYRNKFVDLIKGFTLQELKRAFTVFHRFEENWPYDCVWFDYRLYPERFGTQIGWALLYLDRKNKTFIWEKFYPLSQFRKHPKVNELKSKGIGTIAEINSLLAITDRITSDYRVAYFSHNLENERQKQLDKIGITYTTEDYSVQETVGEYLQTFIKYTNKKGVRFRNPYLGKKDKRKIQKNLMKI